MSSARWLAALAATAGALCVAPPARAAACCVSATTGGVGRLLIWEDYALGVTSSLGVGVGYWDTHADWHAYDGRYSEYEWRSAAWGMFGLGRRASVYARVPWIRSFRRASSVAGSGGGFGDADAGLRYEILAIGEVMELPGIALTASVVAPTGRPVEEADAPLAADATGRGAWVPALGVTLEKTHLPWFVQLGFGASVPLPQERSDLGVSQRYGPGAQANLAAGLEVVPDELVLSASTRFAWEAPLHLDGRAVPGSERTDAGVGLAASWRVHPHWTLQAALDTGLFLDELGDNQLGRVVATLGLRYGHF